MNLLFWALTFGTAGKVMLGITVMMVHWKIVKEHKIDRKVLSEMRRERNLAFLGVILILVGYVLELVFYGYTPLASFDLCGIISAEECARMLDQAL